MCRRPSVCPVPSSPKQGERLSHAVGCAFAACLERKQRREKECGLTAAFDTSRPPVTREGSFRAPDKKRGEHPRGVGVKGGVGMVGWL